MKSSELITPIIATILFSLASVTLHAQTETQNLTVPFWKVKGNAGTDTASNFVGTADAKDLTFRTNNVRRVTITQSGYVGIGTIVPVRMLELSGLTNAIRIGGLATGGAFITAPSATTDKIVFVDDNGDLRAIANGSSGQVLTINGSGVPAWSTSSSSAWNLTGNSGTVDGTNFIGTTDNSPFTVRVNNLQSGRIDHLLSNTFLGYKAGLATTGAYNTAVGADALEANTTGRSNVAIGKDALRNNTSISNLVAIGDSALFSNDNGYALTAVGDKALYANTTGSNSVAIGGQALNANTTGNNNVAVGRAAMNMNTTGGDNTALGNFALQNITASARNTAVGSGALRNSTGGTDNIAIGYYTMSNTTGSYNVGIGIDNMTSVTGHSNTSVGHSANPLLTSGTRNTALGDSAGVTINSLTNTTAIGWNARVTQSNSMVLGSVQGNNGATATPRVGIGTTTPARALHIGNDTLGLRYEGVSTGGSFITATSATTDKILYGDANGDIKAMTAGSTNDVLTYTASGPAWAAGGSSGWALTGNASTTAGTNFVGTTDGVDFVIKTNNTEAMRALSTGQISINQSTPAAGDLFSVYSTNSDDAVNIFANGSGRGMFVSVSSANNSGDGIEVSKGGGTNSSGGRGVDIYMNTNTNGDIGLAVSHSGTGRAGNFQQGNTASTSAAVFASVAGNGRVFNGQNSLTTSTNAVGFFSQASLGTTIPTYQFAAAVWGQSGSVRSGVFLSNSANSNTTVLQGTFNGTAGNDDGIGVLGSYVGNTGTPGYGYGVVGIGNRYGIYANGDVGASGAKPFQIDHPLDPYNKYLKHYSMESPEVLNVYRGNVVLNANGEAVVIMPDYFDSVTTNCSYSLTAIGIQTNVYIKQEIQNRQFVIAGGVPGQKVCWFVYGNRNDLYIRNNPQSSAVEVQKREHEKGKLMRPELYGQPENLGVFYNNINKQFMAPDSNVKDAPRKMK